MRERIIFLLWLVCAGAAFWWGWPHGREAWLSMRNVEIQAMDSDPAYQQGKVIVRQQNAYGDYTLITQRFLPDILLVDMAGEIVYRWKVPVKEILAADPTRKRYASWLHYNKALAYPNGDLLVSSSVLGVTPYGYQLFKLDRNSKILWQYAGPAHHDIYISPHEGRIYTLGHTFREKLPPGITLAVPTLDDTVDILSPDGRLLDSISILDAFAGTRFAYLVNKRYLRKKPWDITHTNSVVRLEKSMARYFPKLKEGSMLVSLRNVSTVAIIDPDTRKVVWAKNRPWYVQHDADFVEGGRILMFDNQGMLRNNKSPARVLEVVPKTRHIAWVFPNRKGDTFYSDHFGRVARLANGNTLITASLDHRVLEVTRRGKIVWEYRIGDGKRKSITMDGKPHYYAIRSAVRYTKEELPFLKQKPD